MSLGLEVEVSGIGLASLASQGTTLPDAVLARAPLVDGVILGEVRDVAGEYPEVT